jgi:hypothetical protein
MYSFPILLLQIYNKLALLQQYRVLKGENLGKEIAKELEDFSINLQQRNDVNLQTA